MSVSISDAAREQVGLAMAGVSEDANALDVAIGLLGFNSWSQVLRCSRLADPVARELLRRLCERVDS